MVKRYRDVNGNWSWKFTDEEKKQIKQDEKENAEVIKQVKGKEIEEEKQVKKKKSNK